MIPVPELNEPLMFWREVPRAFGTPYQRMIFTDEQLKQMLKVFNGTDICFISHNSFPDVDRNNSPITTRVSKLFEDLDCKDKPENALLDLRNLVRWSIKNDLPCASAFSGSKGFHFYLLLKPEKYIINPTLCNVMYSAQKYICQQADTRHHDERIWGDPKRLCRVWYTQYVTEVDKKSVIKDTFCCPLTPEMVLSMGIEEIIEYSKNPKRIEFPEKFSGEYMKLHEFVKDYDIPIEQFNTGDDRGYVKEGVIQEYKKPSDDYIVELFPRPCVHSQLVSDNPTHDARFCAVVRLKSLGYTIDGIEKLFLSLNWIDSHNISTMRYQIKHIFNKVPPYKHPSCSWLKQKGMCVGEKCNRYWKV